MSKEGENVIEIRLWEPVPNQATIKVGSNGSCKGEIIFSGLRGFISGAELLGDAVTPEGLIEAFHAQQEIVEEPCRRALLKSALWSLDRIRERSKVD